MSIEVRIKKKYGDFTLDVNFAAENETLALLGGSGCGKSLTLRCIAGIETPDEGYIAVNDEVFFNSDKKINIIPQKRGVGLLFQNYALFPNMTAVENIMMGIRTKASKAEKKHLALDYMDRFHIRELEDKLPYQMSGGQQQRTALARILIGSPKILMLDEPFSALDSFLKWEMEKEVKRVIKNFCGTTVLVSHNRDEVFRLSDKVAVYNGGHIEAFDTKRNIFENPRTYTTALLTGCKNFSDAVVDGETVTATDWNMKFKIEGCGSGDCIGIRGHYMELAEHDGENIYPYEIIDVTEDTFEYVLTIRLKDCADAKPLFWMVGKDMYHRIPKSGLVRFPAEKFMLLKK